MLALPRQRVPARFASGGETQPSLVCGVAYSKQTHMRTLAPFPGLQSRRDAGSWLSSSGCGGALRSPVVVWRAGLKSASADSTLSPAVLVLPAQAGEAACSWACPSPPPLLLPPPGPPPYPPPHTSHSPTFLQAIDMQQYFGNPNAVTTFLAPTGEWRPPRPALLAAAAPGRPAALLAGLPCFNCGFDGDQTAVHGSAEGPSASCLWVSYHFLAVCLASPLREASGKVVV